MKPWPSPYVPAVPGSSPPLRLYAASAGAVEPVVLGPTVRMYVCGITPYDATHIGHAATYVTFDVVRRSLHDAGRQVVHVQNVTDVDDPLLERAQRDGVSWADLAEREVALFGEDMTALGVLAPDHYVGVVESMGTIVEAVAALEASGAAYRLAVPGGPGEDVYFDLASSASFGEVSGWTREQMAEVFADRGGDPDRPGKRDPFDPLLWLAARPGEPAWEAGVLGRGRPGWHVECSAIALRHLGMGFDIQGGGTDLIFPHHEMSAVQAEGLTGHPPFARHYVHQSMVGLHGEKMSKSQGNLVLVSRLRADGVEPMAIRLALLAHHYRTPWDWTEDLLATAVAQRERWREGLSVNAGPDAAATVAAVRERVADDLDTPGALAAVDAWVQRCLAEGGDDPAAPGLVSRTVDRVLGIRL
ncbi:MAG TPA: cysteine--1-D-myo-inosityl 2-amino-2-deoxy-alpha-D-glucopyranoside ligase [Dermatophilaceae bacterium]|nr:cysteine--1-D-myo-inosityl 2-amino-2-deoxy-alpha-D-glucopyranoside ligase [Dermatophilaceae bacterium]